MAFLNQDTLTTETKNTFRTETIAERRERLARELWHRMQGVVAYGPFKGLELDWDVSWSQADLSSMLLGCYELEIMDAIHAPEFADRTHFVDIGAADGYYAVGCLRNGRVQSADCFELTDTGRETIHRNARRNGVSERLRVYASADRGLPDALPDVDWNDTVVLCDIEGPELELFDDACLDAMKGAMILIEIHNWVDNFWARYKALLERAARHYDLRMLERSGFPGHEIAELRGHPDANRMLMLSEGRPNVMRFLQLVSS